MSIREDVELYAKLSGEDGSQETIATIGAYLRGYGQGKEDAEPHEIGYDDCANALLKMWMDNVLTDGEYYRIANKLNVKWGKVELPEPYKGVTE